MDARTIRKARQLIKENLSNPDLSVSWLAKRLETGLTSLSRTFSKAFGIPCSKYITRCRIEAAKRMLEDGKTEIKQVAHRVGFEDVNYFSRVFKKVTGLSPTSFRRQIGGIPKRRNPPTKPRRKKML